MAQNDLKELIEKLNAGRKDGFERSKHEATGSGASVAERKDRRGSAEGVEDGSRGPFRSSITARLSSLYSRF